MEPEFTGTGEPRRLRAELTGPGCAKSTSGTGWFGTGPSSSVQGSPPPFALAVLAGGCASSAVDVAIFPLDTVKTRLQSPLGFHASGGYRGLFSGVTAAALGAAPGGALFFGSYEFSRAELMRRQPSSTPQWMTDATAACVGATASCLLRNPAIVVQQRMQVGQYNSLRGAISGIVKEGGAVAFYSGLSISIAREIPFAFIQFPIYEALKRLWSGGANREISPSQGALCGSVAGSVAAAATTPLDLLKTRQMLGHAKHGLLRETSEIIRAEGVGALFSGFVPRVGWMALGGYIFFGVYEQCMKLLIALQKGERENAAAAAATNGGAVNFAAATAAGDSASGSAAHGSASRGDSPIRSNQKQSEAIRSNQSASRGDSPPVGVGVGHGGAERLSALAVPVQLEQLQPVAPPPPQQQQQQQVPQLVALLAGGLAGMVIDGALYPVDTYKTRTIQGLPTDRMHTGPLLSRLREIGTLWRGISAAVLPAVPSAAAFFCTYEGVKNYLQSDSTEACCAAAATAEAASCLLRVPAELIKMKMQSGAGGATTLFGAMRIAWAEGGLPSFYRGLGATLCLDLPFALLQFPLYEALRPQISRLRTGGAGEPGAAKPPPRALDGALAGACAGALAAFLTTPLDVIRTRHVLWPVKSGERRSLSSTVLALVRHEGFGGFWRGVLPRTVYMALGGMVYLGTYSYCSEVLGRLLS